MHAEEAAILNDPALNSPEAVHYAAVLISGLREIKNSVAALDQQLNQSVGTGDANEDAQN